MAQDTQDQTALVIEADDRVVVTEKQLEEPTNAPWLKELLAEVMPELRAKGLVGKRPSPVRQRTD